MDTQRNKMHFSWLAAIFVGMLMLVGCGDEEKIPDVSQVTTDFELYRFDSVFYHTDTNDIPAFYDILRKDHQAFLQAYMRVMLSPAIRTVDTVDFLKAMRKHPSLIRIYDTTQMILGDLSKEEKGFAQAMKYAKYYFPNKKTPKFYTYICEFGIPAFISADKEERDLLGCGLDLFLGADFPGYDPMIFPSYIKRSMNKTHLVSRTLQSYTDDLTGGVNGEQFLDYMITNGKSLYVLDHLLPTTPDSVLIKYTSEQMKWCEENEFNMWSHFVHESLLYSTKRADFRKLIDPSPNATGMPPEAPGRTGNYMGWQIIKAYMKRYPKTSFQELMDLKDSKKILKKSKYKPRAL